MRADAHTKALDAINAELGAEVTSLYHRQGQHSMIPKDHDWCQYFSTAGEYVALPYPNVHQDCLQHEPKAGYEAGPLGTATIPKEKSQPGKEERKELVAFESRYIAAQCTGDQQALSTFFAQQYSEIRTGKSLPGRLQEFEVFLFCTWMVFKHGEKMPIVVDTLAQILPNRFSRILLDPNLLENLLIQDNIFKNHLNGSPYQYLPICNQLPPNELKEICLQTVREGFWVERLSSATRRQFLEDEKTRIEYGMYPNNVVPDLKSLVASFERAQDKIDKETLSTVDGEAEMACSYLFPYANQKFAECIAQVAAQAGLPNPFSYMPFTPQQQEMVQAFLSGEYNLEEMVHFLEGLHDDLSKMRHEFWQAVDLETRTAGAAVDFGQLYNMGPCVEMPLATANQYVTGLFNLLSRRLSPLQHTDRTCFGSIVNNAD